MSGLSVLFYKGPEDVFGGAIRLWTRSPYSHCAMCFNDVGTGINQNLIIEAMTGVGVRNRPIGAIDPKQYDKIDIPVSAASCARVYNFLQGEVGCPYDWSGLFWSQVLFIPREHPERWFCSELCAAAIQQLDMLMGKWACTFSPGSLYRILTSGHA